ncbi:MAG: membrane integrity-associated transporter subunit PqiC [Deltaproteobacteria bacterium]|nr:membrane integrity-associated transporter subunit PqiC [Deltaproteobacteria bacterium]
MPRITSLIRAVMSGLLLMTFMGCASNAPSRFYVLSALTGTGGEPETAADKRQVTIGIRPVELPAYLDRQQIVTRVSANELHLAGFDEWAEPLEDNFTRVLMENLSILLSRDSFIILHGRGPEPADYQLQVEVIRFDGTLAGDVSLFARWTILGEDDKKTFITRKSAFKEAAGGPGYKALVAAQSRIVEALCREIAGAIKGLSGAR